MTLTQTAAVLNWLKSRWPITPLQAKEELGIMRLAARIDDIKAGRGCAPHRIETKIIKVQNRDGRECRVAQYSLAPMARFDPATGQGYLALPRETA